VCSSVGIAGIGLAAAVVGTPLGFDFIIHFIVKAPLELHCVRY
jgi:hypothetical protein